MLILCGDVPLVRPCTLQQMIDTHFSNNSLLTVMTTRIENPTGYGRMVCDADGCCCRIVEEKDATDAERKIDSINAGIYCVDVSFLFEALKGVDNNNSQGEMYLTDIVSIACKLGVQIYTFEVGDSIEVLGVNSREELEKAESELKRRRVS